MTAVITETGTQVTDAEAVLALAEMFLNAGDCGCIIQAAEKLRARLEDYDLIRSGDLHPAAEFEDLAYGHPDDALGTALDRVEEEIADLARDLAGEVWEHTGKYIGERAAQDVAGTGEKR